MRVLIVGAGFSGAVVARQLAELGSIRSLVIDSRDHVAGNCHTERDERTGVMVHRYGPHIFHTSNLEVWKFANRFATFRPFVNRVKAAVGSSIFSMPINLHTLNQFFSRQMSPSEARIFLASKADQTIENPENFEEQALKYVGEEIYSAFFKNYTIKQWGCHPRELPASILKRIPVRFDYNDNYYTSDYQGIPEEGYTDLVRRMLDHPLIEVKLGMSWELSMNVEFEHVFYSGPIDRYYRELHGALSYRTVFWDRIEEAGDFQGNAVINYPCGNVGYTRIHEHKHFTPWEQHSRTAAFIEYSKDTGEYDVPYYPKRLTEDMNILNRYKDIVLQERKVTFLGRLATYRYMDMHHVVGEALEISNEWINAYVGKNPYPIMPRASIYGKN